MIAGILLIIFGLKIYDNLDNKIKEILKYLIVGGLTTVVSIVSYYIVRLFIENYLVCTVISWIFAVAFAYITNRVFVFNSKRENIFKECTEFVFSRILSLVAEVAVMYLLVDFLNISDKISKIIVQVIIVILNYIFSKLFVFKENK